MPLFRASGGLVPLSQTQSLRNLGLDITRADINTSASPKQPGVNRFFVTDAQTSDKIVLSERLEEIRVDVTGEAAVAPSAAPGAAAPGKPTFARLKRTREGG